MEGSAPPNPGFSPDNDRARDEEPVGGAGRRSLRVLMLEHDEDDAALLFEALRAGGFEPKCDRVDNETDYLRSLASAPELILANYRLPLYDAPRALDALQVRGLDIPLIVISGVSGEEIAVKTMRAGAADYLLKDRLARLGQAVERALDRREQAALRRAAEQALRNSEERFRVAAEACSDAVYELDLETGQVGVFGSPRERLGYSPGDLPDTLEGWAAILHPEDRERVWNHFRLTMEQGVPFAQDYRVFAKNRKIRYWSDRARLLPESRKVIGVTTDITERVEAQERIASMNTALREISASLFRTQDRERRQFARALHDSIAQSLTAVALNFAILTMLPEIECNASARSTIDECNRMLKECIREVRAFSYILHPPLLDDLGLESALRNYLPGFEERSGISIAFDSSLSGARFAPDAETTVFRFVQEALSNANRHAKASQVGIRLELAGGRLSAVVEDNGSGFRDQAGAPISGLEQAFAGLGLASFRERARYLGGELRIESRPSGSTIRFTIPVTTPKMGSGIP